MVLFWIRRMIARVPEARGTLRVESIRWTVVDGRVISTCSDDEGVVSGEREDGSSRDEVTDGGGEMGCGDMVGFG